MSRLKKAATPKTSRAARVAGNGEEPKNPALLTAIAVGFVFALAVVLFASGLQNKTTVLVAKNDIAPFSKLTEENVVEAAVPSGSVTAADLTPEAFKKLRDGKGVVINRVQIFTGQRVHQSALSDSVVGAYSAVKADERVLAISVSQSGAGGGAVVAGSVVDLISSGAGGGEINFGNEDASSGSVAENLKVLGVGVGAEAARNLTPNGTAAAKTPGQNGNGQITVVVAVPSARMAAVAAAAQNPIGVALAINPTLSFTVNGDLCKVGKDCTQKGGAAAGKPGSVEDPTGNEEATNAEGETGATEKPTEDGLPQDPTGNATDPEGATQNTPSAEGSDVDPAAR